MSDNKPTHRAFIVTDKGEGVKADWKEVAAAWSHRDGKGMDIIIPQGMSLSGRLVIREASERPEQTAGVKQAARPTR
jgi:hypothetical protein